MWFPQHLPPFRRNTHFRLLTAILCTSALSAVDTSQVYAQQNDSEMEVEEVIVTGSFIRRSEGFTAASPVVQMTSEDLDAEGTVNMAQVVQNMTFNGGTAVTNSIQGVTDNSPAFNLRGLGPSATLQLVDGKRVTTNNVNALIPSIAVQRMDIVTDGAAALYGSDAVAGVVNIIPYTQYEGIKMDLYQEGDSRGDYSESSVGLLAGARLSDDIHVTGAVSYRDQGRLRWIDRPELMTSGLTLNSGSHPGNFLVPVRDEMGNLTGGTMGRPDPSCGLVSEDPRQMGNNPYGINLLGRCWLEFGDTRDFRSAQEFSQFYGNFEYAPAGDFSLSAQVMLSRKFLDTRNNQSNPGGRVQDMSTIRGELPGNTFRAMSSDRRELFASPLRDGSGSIITDGYGRPLPMRDANGQVVLANNQFASMDADPNGGVPFYEDVRANAWMPIGKSSTLPTGFNADGTNPLIRDDRNMRVAFTANFPAPILDGWEGMASYAYNKFEDRGKENQTFSFSAIEAGLNCDVINSVQDCYNPFGVVDQKFATSQAVTDAIWNNYARRNEDELQTFDLVFNGDVRLGDFQLPGGEIGMAVGYQRRQEKLLDVPSADILAGDQFIGSQLDVAYGSRSVNAWFAEVLLPVFDQLEITSAFRSEKFSSGQDDSIAKIGLVYEPVDWMGIRATWGQAFIAPTIRQLESPEDCGLSSVNDPFTTFQGFVTSCKAGNPGLQSETSTSMSAGIDLIPMEGMTLSITWSETDFEDRIVSTTTEDTIRTDFKAFQQAYNFVPTQANPYPSLELLQQWIDDPRSDKRITRVPGDIETVQRIQQGDANASTMLVKAWDTRFSYDLPFRRWGNFDINLQATYVDTYQFQMKVDDPVREAAGNQNNPYGAVPAMPRLRANSRLRWTMNDHQLALTARYTHGVRFDANQYDFQRFFPYSTFRYTTEIRPWTQMDMFYTYRGLDVPGVGGELSLTLGSRNVFDREAQKTGMIAGAFAELQDVMGRVVYGRINYQF